LEKAYEEPEKYDFSGMDGNMIREDMTFFKICRIACGQILKSKGFEEIFSYPDDFKFDLILVDFVCSSCLLPLVHKFKYPPVIGLFGYDMAPYRYNYIGGHDYPAYGKDFKDFQNFLKMNLITASINLFTFDTNMNFWERLQNTFMYKFEYL
jgi:glucuronosyltransferase